METNKKLQNLIGNAIGKDYSSHTFIQVQSHYNPITGLNDVGGVPVESGEQEPTLNDLLLAINKNGFENTYTPSLNLVYSINAVNNGLEIGDHIYYNLEKSIFNQEESVKVALIGLLEDKYVWEENMEKSKECKHEAGIAGGVAYCKKCGLKYQTEEVENIK